MNQPLGDPLVQLLDAVRQAKPVVALLGADPQAVSAVVDACVAQLSNDPIRVVRVRGLPGVPLTLSRIVEEIGAGQHGGARVDDDELIVRVLATRSQGESQVVLILEQAELLPLPTLAFLQVALAVFGARTPRLQLLFAGRPRFAYLIDRDELTSLRDRLEVVARVLPPLVGPKPGLAAPQFADFGEVAAKPRIVAGLDRRQWAFAAVPALLLVTVAATLAQFWHGAARPPTEASSPVSMPLPARIDPPAEARSLPQDAQPPPAPALPQAEALPQDVQPPPAPALLQDGQPSPVPALPPQAEALPQDAQPSSVPALPPQAQVTQDEQPPPAPALPPQAAEPAPVPQPPSREPSVTAPTPGRALPSNEQLTRLRGEFDRFLSQTEWGSKRLSENERSRLFNEYLRWNYGALAASPATPP